MAKDKDKNEVHVPEEVMRIDRQYWQGTGLMNDDSTGSVEEDKRKNTPQGQYKPEN